MKGKKVEKSTNGMTSVVNVTYPMHSLTKTRH